LIGRPAPSYSVRILKLDTPICHVYPNGTRDASTPLFDAIERLEERPDHA
jgi:hypothetical protein